MKPRPVEGLDPGGSLRPNAGRIVGVRLDELRSFAESALAPDASRAQHDMRIAAKRLRYLLEIFGDCLGEDAGDVRRAAKQLQSVLGDLHDCALMLSRVEGVESAAAVLRDRRERLFGEFVSLWQAETVRDTWSALERHVASFFLE
jgi:CHAD domain-containing protein